jgi:hypothetical protein
VRRGVAAYAPLTDADNRRVLSWLACTRAARSDLAGTATGSHTTGSPAETLCRAAMLDTARTASA